MFASNRVLSVQKRNEARAGYATFSPDGRYVAVGWKDLWLWDLESGWKVQPFEPVQDMIYSLAISPDQRFLISGSTEFITLWEIETGRLLYRLYESAFSLNFTLDGNSFIYKDLMGSLHLRDIESGRCLRTFEPLTYSVEIEFFQSVAISPDGKYALYGSQDSNTYLWDLETGEIVHTFRARSGYSFCTTFTPDGMTTVSGRTDGTITMWDVKTGFKAAAFQAHSGCVECIAVSSDGNRMLSGDEDGSLILWDLETAKKIAELRGHLDRIVSISFSPDGTKAFSFSHDGTVRIWDIH